MRISLFKQKGPKGFNFKARYYDADKEELHARVELLKRDLQADEEAKNTYQGGEILRQKMRANRSHYSNMNAAKKKSNMRILMIVGLLVAAFFLFMTYS